MLGYYNYTVILTYMGMLTAFTGILAALGGNVSGALLCLMAAGIFDMVDGPVARLAERTEEEKRFGIQIDSLSDLISFGVLPGIILYVSEAGSGAGFFLSSVYVLCALIRLAYFNVTEEKRQNEESGERTCYQGLPVTMAAVILPLARILGNRTGLPGINLIAVLIMAAAFLSPFKVKKPRILGKIALAVLGCFGFLLLAGGAV